MLSPECRGQGVREPAVKVVGFRRCKCKVFGNKCCYTGVFLSTVKRGGGAGLTFK